MERILVERLVETVLRNRFEESQYMVFLDGIFRGFNVETARINNPVDDVSGIWSARFPSILIIRQHGTYTDQNGEILSLLTIYLKHMDLMRPFFIWWWGTFWGPNSPEFQLIDLFLLRGFSAPAKSRHFHFCYVEFLA